MHLSVAPLGWLALSDAVARVAVLTKAARGLPSEVGRIGSPPGAQGCTCVTREASCRSSVSAPHFTRKEAEALWPGGRAGTQTQVS